MVKTKNQNQNQHYTIDWPILPTILFNEGNSYWSSNKALHHDMFGMIHAIQSLVIFV